MYTRIYTARSTIIVPPSVPSSLTSLLSLFLSLSLSISLPHPSLYLLIGLSHFARAHPLLIVDLFALFQSPASLPLWTFYCPRLCCPVSLILRPPPTAPQTPFSRFFVRQSPAVNSSRVAFFSISRSPGRRCLMDVCGVCMREEDMRERQR